MSVSRLFTTSEGHGRTYEPQVAAAIGEVRGALAMLEQPSARWRQVLAELDRAQRPLGGETVVDLTARTGHDELFDLMARLVVLVDPYTVWDEGSPA